MTWRVLPAKSFTEYRKDWDQINNTGPNSPVLNSALISYALDAFGTGDEQLALFIEDDLPTAIAIFEKRKFGVWDTFQPSQAPLATWVNKCSLPLHQLLKLLSKALPGIVLQVGITQQDPDIYPRPKHEKRLSTFDYIQTARVTTTGSFDDYWSARGKNLRHNMKRQRNRLTKEGVTIKFDMITEPNAVYDAIVAYGKLESAGWKSAGGTAIHADNSQGQFYINLLKDFCGRGKGVICQYYYDDHLVATDLCIEQGGTFVILKTTYDEKIKTSSPAFLMRQELFEKLFLDEQVQNIEFYGKVMEWHTKWSDQIRTLYHLNYRII